MDSNFDVDIYKINKLKEQLPDNISLQEYLEYKILETLNEVNEREGEVHALTFEG